MQKPAITAYELHPLIRDRWSPYCFSSRPIEPRLLGSLFEAARWAPSSYNEQPWAFCLATQDQPGEFATLLGCLMEANQAWAKRAYALVLSLAKMSFERNGKPNRHALDDTGSATENLMLQAGAVGVCCHPMGGFDAQRARAVLAIPATHEPVTMIAIGYPAENDAEFEESLRQRNQAARSRKALSEFVFSGAFGKTDARIPPS